MNRAMTVGDAGTGNTDASYGGEDGSSPMSMQYFREEARKFQGIMDALDEAAVAAQSVLDAGPPPEDADALRQYLREFDSKKVVFRATAQAINAGAYLINQAGGRFPVMQVPQTLGFLPALPVTAVIAIATASTLIVWGREWLKGLNQRLTDARMLEAIEDPEARAQAAQAVLAARAAQVKAEGSPWTSVANVVKWGSIAWLAWMAYQRFR